MKKIFFSLLKSALWNNPIQEEIKNLITPDKLSSIYRLSKRHDLAHLVGDALDKNGLLSKDSKERKLFLQERNLAICRYEQMQYELKRICEVLENQQIKFIPLKGAVIRNLYPEPWMRTSCDIDILIKNQDLQRTIDALKTQLLYRDEGIGEYDANLYSEGGVHLELRYNPSAVSQKSKEVLSKIWDNVIDKEKYNLTLTNEMLYYYHIEHMAGHFVLSGCGVRFFLDAFILNNTLNFDEEVRQTLLSESGLTNFSKTVKQVSEYWFGEGSCNQLVQEVEEYVLRSGIYGSMENRVAIGQIKRGRLSFILSRIFLPYRELKFKYPKLQKYPFLYPFYQVKRWCNLLKKDRRKKSKKELFVSADMDNETILKIENLFQELDLNLKQKT